jgi:hypothetical protein
VPWPMSAVYWSMMLSKTTRLPKASVHISWLKFPRVGEFWCVGSLLASLTAAASTRYCYRTTLLQLILISASCSCSVGSLMNINTLNTTSWTKWSAHRTWLTLRFYS